MVKIAEGNESEMSADLHERKVLFLSPTPALSPLLQAQGIPHMRELHCQYGIDFTLFSIEEPDWSAEDCRRSLELKEYLRSSGIEWHIMRSGRMPFMPDSTSNVFRGVPHVLRLITRNKIDIVHCRSYVAAYIMLAIRKLISIKFIFDVRGFYPDELVRDGLWSEDSLAYKVSKWLETKSFREADSIVVVTRSQLDKLQYEGKKRQINKVFLIPNCVDIKKFKPSSKMRLVMRREYGCEDRTVFLWLVGGIRKVHLPKETIAFFKVCRNYFKMPLLLVLTHTPNIRGLLQSEGLSEQDYIVMSVSPEKVPLFLQMSDIGLGFIDPSHEGIGIKFAEYLAGGLSVVTNGRLVDNEQTALIKMSHTGVVVEDFTDAAYAMAVDKLALLIHEGEVLRTRCREMADQYYSLNSAVERYAEVYSNVLV